MRYRACRAACSALLALAGVFQPCFASTASAYSHPGGLYTELHYTDIFMTLMLQVEPWWSAYGELSDKAGEKWDWQPQPVQTLLQYAYDDPRYPESEELIRPLAEDAYAAYVCALSQQIQGDPDCLRTTIDILNAWARVNTGMSDPHHTALGVVVLGTGLMLAAEIARGSGSWSQADFNQFRVWADRVYKPASDRAIGSHENNWRSWGILGRLLYAHLFDNTSLFATGTRDLRNHINASIEWDGRQPHELTRGENGIWYSYFSLSPITAAAAVVRNTTGANLFTESTDEAIKLKKALQYLFHYVRHPDRWPHWPEGVMELTPSWSYSKSQVDLFETMGGTYGIADFANFAAPHRTVYGGLARNPDKISHFSWNFPTFNLPVDHAELIASDAFDDNGIESWEPHAGAWSVARMVSNWPTQYIYNQTDVNASDALTVFGSTQWSDYEVSALFRGNTLGGSARFGLIASFRDARNWTRFAVDMAQRSARIDVSNNGLVTTVASTALPFPIASARWYNLRAVVDHGNLRFFIDDELVARATVTTQPGQVGLYAHRSDVSFDTLVVKQPRMPLHGFQNGAGPFAPVKGSWSIVSDAGVPVYRQRNNTTTMATAVAGDSEWLDYRAEAQLKANTFNPAGLAGVGLYARYRDANNYYNFHFYKTASGSGELRIEKRFAGTVSTLAAMPFTMQIGRWYRMAADVSGPRLRFYVDGVKMLEVSDTQLYSGKIALDAHRTDASFTSVEVY